MTDTKSTVICIACPVGCEVTLALDSAGIVRNIEGHQCKRGRDYCVQEAKDPRRWLTSTVAVEGGACARVPVRSSKPLPLGKVRRAAAEARAIKCPAPIRRGQIILASLAGEPGIDLIAVTNVAERNRSFHA